MAIKYVDAHTHPLKEYYKDNFKVIEKAYSKGVSIMMITGCNEKENNEVINICKNFDFTFPVIGIHPTETKGAIDGLTIENQLTKDVKGIGEIGLDFYWKDVPKNTQIESLNAQIKIAQKYDLPVVIHMRDAYQELYDILKNYKNVKFMIHTYSGNLEWAKKFYDLGCYFSFGGVVTYKNAAKTVEVVDWLPVDRILTETDAPYLTPAQKRGEWNYSNYVIYTLTFIAGIKKLSIEKMADIVFKNAKNFFKLNVSKK
ncbi:TatD family hydrolase [Mycoplasma sp. Mirounga ES2805-ORL]|uniref:TatD family hydrolase n=1 Tax=Mycoplasma sp. Mirounga ES2805-ORL TaxID=754514 RepID=UPI00197B8E4E|nr:TatD family hydrolase [Mycoplasma sp. Mirounga ES2805-ORL]QSF13668.1 TatD family hydrolase [Mycoplasma sp. Mirounga ES2805-ORL]